MMVNGVEYGMSVSCLTSASMEPSAEPPTLPLTSTEAKTPFDSNETNLASPHLHVVDKSTFVIVDGFHRYYTMKTNPDIFDLCHGCLPVVVIEKDINDRMASTVRHNRARGKHSVEGMSNMVFQMLANGWEDAAICNELGMEPEELLRLKHITGFSKLYADHTYSKAWVGFNQIRIKHDYQDAHPEEALPGDFT
jgi:hypothetical protein